MFFKAPFKTVFFLSLCLGSAFVTSGMTAADQPPNILLILADNYGWGDVFCNNPESVFQTPHLDRIAHEGLRFTNAHTPHSVCTPTRYSLLTGRYAWRTELREGVLIGYGKSLIRPGRDNLAALLKRHGYETGVFGKWHLGLDWEPVEGDPGDWIWGTQI
jgi:arylsulfatase A-like enzyme